MPTTEATDFEIVKRVLEDVAGYRSVKWSDFLGLGGIAPGDEGMSTITDPLHDANADYRVLQRVREAWKPEPQRQFRLALLRVWYARQTAFAPQDWYDGAGEFFERYEPGDYTRAAYHVLTEEE